MYESHLYLVVMRFRMTTSGRPSPYCCRDRGSTNRQRHPVVDEGEIMLENIFSDVGIQEVLASNQGVNSTEEDAHVFTTHLWRKTLQ